MAGMRVSSRPTTVVLIVVGLIVASTAQRSWSQQPDPDLEEFLKIPKATAAFKEFKSRSEPVAGDNSHQALLRLRLRAAAQDAEFRFRLSIAGARGFQPRQVLIALQSVGEAELALLDAPADRVAVHYRLLDVARPIEICCKTRYEVGNIAEQDLLSARQICATCELAAIDARRNPPKPAPKQVYPPPFSDFAPDTIERTTEQGMTALRQLASDEPSVAPGTTDERKKLLIEQRTTLLLALALRIRIWESGAPNSGVGTLFGNDLLLNVSKNELALDDRPSNQLRIAEHDLVVAKMLEAIAKKLNESSGVPWNRQRYDRLSAELKVMELRQAFPRVAASKPRKIENHLAAPKTGAESNPFALTEAERAELSKLVGTDEPGVLTINSELITPIHLLVSVEPEPGDDEWRKLAKSRHAWARSELRLRLQMFQLGARGHTTTDLVGAVQRFEESALALAKDPSKRTAIIECVSKLFRLVDLVDRQRVAVGQLSPIDLWISQVAGLDARIRLLDERRK